MKFVTLLRHAKAVPVEPGSETPALPDIDRPLTGRGRRASEWVGTATAGQTPDTILCSAASRTRETLAGILPAWSERPEILIEPELYLAEAPYLLARLGRLPAKINDVWVIGHNPGLHDLALDLAGGVPRVGPGRELAFNFPTAARVRLAVDIAEWTELRRGICQIIAYEVPPHG